MAMPLMLCGHAANSFKMTDEGRVPACVICYGIDPRAQMIDPDPPSLEGRTAKCSMCDRTVPSSANLAFFEHRPDRETDLYYSGCRGWD